MIAPANAMPRGPESRRESSDVMSFVSPYISLDAARGCMTQAASPVDDGVDRDGQERLQPTGNRWTTNTKVLWTFAGRVAHPVPGNCAKARPQWDSTRVRTHRLNLLPWEGSSCRSGQPGRWRC